MIKSVFLAVLSVFCSVAVSDAQVTFALRMVARCDAKDASPPMAVEGEQQKFCLQQQAIVDQGDVQSAEVASEPNGPVVRLTLTPAGSQKLLETTRNNIGNRIGVVLNAQLVATPIVQAPVANGIPIHGHFTQQQASDIAAAFNRQAPRR
jgi:preprotein translocase subunit SecD